jgi:hypothetical protein
MVLNFCPLGGLGLTYQQASYTCFDELVQRSAILLTRPTYALDVEELAQTVADKVAARIDASPILIEKLIANVTSVLLPTLSRILPHGVTFPPEALSGAVPSDTSTHINLTCDLTPGQTLEVQALTHQKPTHAISAPNVPQAEPIARYACTFWVVFDTTNCAYS